MQQSHTDCTGVPHAVGHYIAHVRSQRRTCAVFLACPVQSSLHLDSQAILVLILALYAEVRAIGQRWEKTSTYVKIIYTLLVISSALLSALGLLGALVYFSGEGHWEAYAWSARTAVAFLISTCRDAAKISQTRKYVSYDHESLRY